MTIITISRGSYSRGKEVAEGVAERLGLECVSREVLLDASDRFHIPEIRLVRAIHDAPSILDRFRQGRQIYIAYIRSALATRMVAGDVIYHGLAGHILLAPVPHLLKVRITADLEQRIAAEMAREHIPYTAAREIITRDDQERRRWTRSLHAADPWDSSLYDLVIGINALSVSDAVDLICAAANKEPFASTPERLQRLSDFSLACRVKASIVDTTTDAWVTASFGNVVVSCGSASVAGRIRKMVPALREDIPEITHLEVHAEAEVPDGAV